MDAGHLLALARPLVIEAARLTAWLVLLLAVFVPLERLWALQPQRVLRRGLGADLGFYFLNGLLLNLLLAVPVAILAALLRSAMPGSLLHATTTLPLWAKLAATLVVGELGYYWGHRLSHAVPLLWRFHEVHHSAEQLDWLVNTRAHPVDLVITRLCAFVPVYALGFGQASAGIGGLPLLLVILFGTIWGFFIHANLRWRFGWLEQVVATPGFHHWHHTAEPPHDRNFAAVLPVLDRLFGTLHLPRTGSPNRYGLAEAPRPAPAEHGLPAPQN